MASTPTATSRRVFAVLGTTDDITTCELCGRSDLRSTVVLDVLDAEGMKTGDLVYYGSDCAGRAAGWTTREVNQRIRDAQRREREAARAAREERSRRENEAFIAWCARELGVTVPDGLEEWRRLGALHDALRTSGRRVVPTLVEFTRSEDGVRFRAENPVPGDAGSDARETGTHGRYGS